MNNRATCLLCTCIAVMMGNSLPAQDLVTPAKLPRIGSVDDRFQSYNVEMIEITGGRFWKAYKDLARNRAVRQPVDRSTPAGMDPNLYEYRPPIDLTNARLRRLAAALGPAYIRVSGTWANTTYFQNDDAPALLTPPKGFDGVLTRSQWTGAVDFAQETNSEIVTSFAISPGTRDAGGLWTPVQARELLSYTKGIGGRIAAAEFMNEPTAAEMGGAPKGYDAAAYARDIEVFRPFLKQEAPEAIFLGPGSVGEGGVVAKAFRTGTIGSEDLLKATGSVFDAFSYHLYPAVSQRCAGLGAALQASAPQAISTEWFTRIDGINSFYAGLRDRFEPGKPLWITETADAACGGNPWGATFLDTFRYLYEHGRLAQQGVQVIMHNTLASSDYGLLDQNTFQPRPNYWAALLWRKLMGTVVLDPGTVPSSNTYLFAHCLRGSAGGVALLAINADPKTSHDIRLATESERYILSANSQEDTRVKLNGRVLALGANDALPEIAGSLTAAGHVTLAPRTITFLAIPNAGNESCR